MAEAALSLSSEHVQRLLQCAICLDKFKRPKLLPCQHTFCLTPCLEGLIDHRTRSLRCPECRADHFLPRGGPANFPNNLTIIGFLSLSETLTQSTEAVAHRETAHPETHPETAHDQPNETEAMCPRPTRANSNPGRRPRASGGCSVCRDDAMILRCCHCDWLVCEVCHQDHMEQARRDLARLIGIIQNGLPHISDQISTMHRKEIHLQNLRDRVKTEITEAVEKHLRDLRARERSLHEDVDSFYQREFRRLRNCKENAQVEAASLSSFCDSAESLLGGRQRIPDGDVIEMKRQCEEYVDVVQTYEDGTNRPPNTRHIQAVLESPFLSSTINSFGDLIITPASTPTVLRPITSELSNIEQPNGDDPTLASSFLNTLSSDQMSIPQDNQRMRNDESSPASSPIERQSVSILSVIDSRSPSTSPMTPRRETTRPSQVTFVEEVPSRWQSLSETMRSSRRSRQDRLSDTRIADETRRPTLIQQLRDRTRHLSLGAVVHEEGISDEIDLPMREDSEVSQAVTVPRRVGRRDAVEIGASFSYPGAGFNNELWPRDENGSPWDNEGTAYSSPSSTGRRMPSIYVNAPQNGYNRKGEVIMQIGSRGSGSGEFIWPRGISVSPLDDYIYVCDSSNHRVQIFDQTGRFFKSFGRYGQGDGEFDCLAGVAVTGLGQVIITDRYNHRIQMFDRIGNFQKSFGSVGSGNGELNYPWGVACDNMGFIYVCDKENHRIQVFQSNGSFVRSFGEYGSHNGQFENPHYVAVSPDNKVYVSDSSNHRVQVFSLYGDFLFSFGGSGSLRGQMKFPRGIAIDIQGFVVVADSGNNRIQVFRADGRYQSMFGQWGSENGQFKGLEGLAIQVNGRVVVSDRENHRIQIF